MRYVTALFIAVAALLFLSGPGHADAYDAWRRDMAQYCRAYPWAPACGPQVVYVEPAYPPGYGVALFAHQMDRLLGGHRHRHGRDDRRHSSGGGYDPRNPCGGRPSRC